MLRPKHFTTRPRKYLADRRYEAATALEIFGGGHLATGTRFSATGHMGSALYKPCRGKRHPKDLLVEIRFLRKCKQPNVYDTCWIPARLFDNPFLILRLRKKRKREQIRRNIDREVNNIRRRAMSV